MFSFFFLHAMQDPKWILISYLCIYLYSTVNVKWKLLRYYIKTTLIPLCGGVTELHSFTNKTQFKNQTGIWWQKPNRQSDKKYKLAEICELLPSSAVHVYVYKWESNGAAASLCSIFTRHQQVLTHKPLRRHSKCFQMREILLFFKKTTHFLFGREYLLFIGFSAISLSSIRFLRWKWKKGIEQRGFVHHIVLDAM